MIPTYKSLEEVYENPSEQTERFKQIANLHSTKFNVEPDFVIRAPGRVNIIGDHIDYCYFSCLPMAIACDTVMAVTLTDDNKVEVTNLDSDQYADFEFTSPASGELVAIDRAVLHWGNYLKAGYNVGINHLRKTNKDLAPRGMKITMHGNSPPGGGLSSSAAFVVSATLLTLKANGVDDVDEMDLIRLSMTSEQMLGMNTGGMDQAASICGKREHALLVSFRPELKVEPESFNKVRPSPIFLIANSFAVSVKHLTAPIHYNLRVVEVSIAASILAKKLGIEIVKDGNLNTGTLRGVLEAYLGTSIVKTEHLNKMIAVVKEHLHPEGYTTEEAANLLEISVDELKKRYMSVFPVRYETLKLFQRSLHVYEESLRVLDFVEILNDNNVIDDSAEKLGSLMNGSHQSAVDLFEHSHPDVDELISVARKAGALGSRVTGAGFGGYTVHLVTADTLDSVVQGLKKDFYEKKFGKMTEDAVLVSKPGSGACLLDKCVLRF